MNKQILLILVLFCVISCRNKTKEVPSTKLAKQDSLEIARLDKLCNQLQYSQPDSSLELALKRREIFQRYANSVGIINYYNTAGCIHSMVKQDHAKGKIYADSAWQFAQKPGNQYLLYKANYGYGIYYMYRGDLDSASQYFLTALQLQPQMRDSNFYQNTHAFLSDIYASQGNYQSALKYYEPLIEKAEREKESTTSIIFYLGGYAYAIENKDKDSLAFSYLQKALNLAKSLNYPTMNSAIYTYLAEYYQKKNAIDSSMGFAQMAVETIQNNPQPFDKIEKPYIALLNNYCKQSDYFTALKTLKEAKKQIDTSKVLSEDLVSLYEVEYNIYNHNNDREKAYAVLQTLNSLQAENFKLAKDDQLLKHEKELKKLAAEKTILKKDAQIRRQKSYNYILIGALILLAIVIGFVYIEVQRRRKIQYLKLMQIQKEKELQQEKELLKVQIEERNRISQEMHDDLGSTLTTVHMGLNLLHHEPGNGQYLQIIDKATSILSAQINEAIWNLNVRNDYLYSLIGFFSRYAKEFLSNTNIQLHLNDEKIVSDFPISGIIRRGLYLSLKELLNNTVKYAKAKNVYCDFEFNGSILKIKIKDDGVGFNDEVLEPKAGKGNGLKNIKAAIVQLGGAIHWENKSGMQTIIELSLI